MMNETCSETPGARAPQTPRSAARRGSLGPSAVDAVEAWARAGTGRLLRVANRYLRDEDAAEQVVRDVMLSALRAVSAGEPRAAGQAWLREQTLARTLERWRARPHRGDPDIEHLLPRFRADGSREDEPDTGGPVDDEEVVAAMRRQIERLPEQHRTVYLLKTVEGLDLESIARHLGLDGTAVRRLLHEARLALCCLWAPKRRRRAARAGGRRHAGSFHPARLER